MAVITPQTDVYLIKCPLEINDINQLTFANAQAQFNYFNSLPKIPVDNFTYQRKDGTMRFGMHFDDLISYNYVMYRNDAYSSKWFYAFITDMQYLNDNVTAITIKTDVWQTWQFDLRYKRVFVEREHANTDAVGSNTIPENLELGEYIRNGDQTTTIFGGQFYLAFQVTEYISNMPAETDYKLYNGIYNGLHIVMVDSYATADLFVKAYDDAGKHDSIISCFYVPKNLIGVFKIDNIVLHNVPSTIYYPRQSSSAQIIGTHSITKPTTLDSYNPVNKKLLTYPYSYLLVTNNAGAEAIYHFEDWRNESGSVTTTADFKSAGALSQGCAIKTYPDGSYKRAIGTTPQIDDAYIDGIVCGKFPLCSWNSDYYTNWVTQNAVNIGVETAQTAIGFGANLLSGNIGGAVNSLIGGIGGQLAKQYQASLVPNQAKGNLNTGDLNFSMARAISFYPMSIKREYAQIIDQFFSMFGYATRRVKLPNITGRRNWNYVKTQGCYIDADIPQDDLAEIKGMFDRGITFWHNPTTFADYSQNNDII